MLFMATIVFYLFKLYNNEPWKDHTIRRQHMWNEILMYGMCVEMVLFNGWLKDGDVRATHGAWFATMLVWMIMINVKFITLHAYHHYGLHIKRA